MLTRKTKDLWKIPQRPSVAIPTVLRTSKDSCSFVCSQKLLRDNHFTSTHCDPADDSKWLASQLLSCVAFANWGRVSEEVQIEICKVVHFVLTGGEAISFLFFFFSFLFLCGERKMGLRFDSLIGDVFVNVFMDNLLSKRNDKLVLTS